MMKHWLRGIWLTGWMLIGTCSDKFMYIFHCQLIWKHYMLHLQPNTMRWKVEKIEFKSNTFLLYNIRMKLNTSKVSTRTVFCDMVMVIAIWCLGNRWQWIIVFTVFILNFKFNLLTLHLSNLMTITIYELFDLWDCWLGKFKGASLNMYFPFYHLFLNG